VDRREVADGERHPVAVTSVASVILNGRKWFVWIDWL